jgi:hypothetical protein
MPQELFDINKFPPTWGMLVFPISMSRIEAGQSPKEYAEFLHYFTSKVQTPEVGVHFFYTEGLYMNTEEHSFETKNAFIQKMVNHKNGIQKFLQKNLLEFQIQNAFTFESWFQMCLNSSDFVSLVARVKKLSEEDEIFSQLLIQDSESINKNLDEKQLQFFIEEFVFSYLIVYGQIQILNPYVNGKEEWLLLCYPGKPFKSQIYFVQKNICGFEKKQKAYIGHYDLSEKKYYDFLKIDINSL